MAVISNDDFTARGARRTLSLQVGAEAVGVLALVGVGLLILFTKNSSFFNFWTDRDMVRSANLLNEFQYMAAELSYGAASRVPGGALHYLWFIPTAFSSDPNVSYKFCILLCLLAAIPFYLAMRASFGASAAIVSTAVLMASPTTFSTMMRLWNPSFQVPFLFLAYAFLIRLLAAGDKSAFKWLVASLVLGMQMHVSTWLLMIAVIITLLLTRTRIPRREALLSVALTLLLLSPYLIGEMLTGWDNIRTMLASQGRGAVRQFDLAKGFLFNFDNSRDIWAWLSLAFAMNDNLPAPPFQTAVSWLHNIALVAGGLFVLASLSRWLVWGRPLERVIGMQLGGGTGRLVVGALVPIVLAFAYISYSPQLELVIYGNSRYVMYVVPGVAILAGLGAAAVMSMAREWLPARAVASLVVAVMTAGALWSLSTSVLALSSAETPPGRQFMGSFEIVRRDRNWTMEDTIARMSVLRTHDAAQDRWIFESVFAIGYELYRYGKSQPFARGGECVAYLTRGTDVYGEKGITVEALARSFEQPGLELRLISQRAVGRDRLVVYERPGKPCFTTITNRYVFSPEETVTFKQYGSVPNATAVETKETTVAGQRAFVVNIGNGVYAMVKLSSRDGRLAVELHSNQLRGDTYNGGFLDAGMIAAPTIVAIAPGGGVQRMELVGGLVGGKGTFTPIRGEFAVPEGLVDLELHTEVYPVVPLGTWPVDFGAKKPVAIPIVKHFRVER
jgi:hypothetical protein